MITPDQWIHATEVLAKAILISVCLTLGIWLIQRGRR